MIQKREIFEVLHSIERGDLWVWRDSNNISGSYLSMYLGEVKYKVNNGWRLTVLFAGGRWYHIISVTTPEGRELTFEDFTQSLKEYKPIQNVRKIMYGEPGMDGCDLLGELFTTVAEPWAVSDSSSDAITNSSSSSIMPSSEIRRRANTIFVTTDVSNLHFIPSELHFYSDE